MLRNVLEDYLSSVKERDFYYPFSALLHAMGFYDIHITDGGREFGKDFIAKRLEANVVYQYVIQAKRGDIKQHDFRNNIMGQLMEAVVIRGLSHPQLDRNETRVDRLLRNPTLQSPQLDADGSKRKEE